MSPIMCLQALPSTGNAHIRITAHTQQKMVLMICSFEHVQGVLCTYILTAILQQQMEAKGFYMF